MEVTAVKSAFTGTKQFQGNQTGQRKLASTFDEMVETEMTMDDSVVPQLLDGQTAYAIRQITLIENSPVQPLQLSHHAYEHAAEAYHKYDLVS